MSDYIQYNTFTYGQSRTNLNQVFEDKIKRLYEKYKLTKVLNVRYRGNSIWFLGYEIHVKYYVALSIFDIRVQYRCEYINMIDDIPSKNITLVIEEEIEKIIKRNRFKLEQNETHRYNVHA